VLDNCEHVMDGMSVVASLLAAAPSVRVLATSRTPLRIGGEREYPVGPLALEADRAVPDRLAPAVRLFADRAMAAAPDFALTGTNVSVVNAICRQLDALPLAIELAAPWLKVLRPDDLLRRLYDDVLPPVLERRDLPERQQTMNATVAWSYRLLSTDEQRTFRCLGVLPGSFPIEAAAAVLSAGPEPPVAADDALLMVARLIERSLLLRAERPSGVRPLYRMLETVRAYAGLELAASQESDVAMAGLARYCVTAAAVAGEHLTGHAQGEWLGPNLWTGIGRARLGVGTALVGSGENVAARLREYVDEGIDTFILSGYPHKEEAKRFGRYVIPHFRGEASIPMAPRELVTA
jgi:predicted ATPase